MLHKGLGIAEALALLQELHSDPKLVASEDENDGENIPLSLFLPAYENLEGESDNQSQIHLENDIDLPGPS